MISDHRPAGITALALFFGFGALMSALAAIALATPGGPLDAMWRVNPAAREGFATLGPWAVLLMIVVCAGCALAAYGLWHLRPWGRHLAIIVLLINMVGDTANAVLRKDLRTLMGVVIGGAMIAYLLSNRLRARFQTIH